MAAADSIKYWQGSGTVKDPPFGLHKQPEGSPPWEVFDHVTNTFVPGPAEWAQRNVGPAKFEYFVQVNLQMNNALSHKKAYRYIYLCVWHPACPIRIYRTQYHRLWTEEVLIPLLQFSYFEEFHPALVDFQANHQQGNEVTDEQQGASLGIETLANNANFQEILRNEGLDDDHDCDLGVAIEVNVGLSALPAGHRPTDADLGINPGGLHDHQSDLASVCLIYRPEFKAILLHSDCDPFAISSQNRLDFLLQPGSINKATELVLEKILPGWLLFIVVSYNEASGLNCISKLDVPKMLRWLIKLGKLCPAFERLRKMLDCIVCIWAGRSAAKVGGMYVMKTMLAKLMIENKAAVGRDIYTDLKIHQMVQCMTKSDKKQVALMLSSENNFGSHFRESDHTVETFHDQIDRLVPKDRTTSERYGDAVKDITTSGPMPGGDLHHMGSFAPCSKSGSYGDVRLTDGALLVFVFFRGRFPLLPSPLQTEQANTFSWIDTNDTTRTSDELIDIGGNSLLTELLDVPRIGRVSVAHRLRTTVFGQTDAPPVSGLHGPSDVDPTQFDVTTAFKNAKPRIPRLLKSNEEIKNSLRLADARLTASSKDLIIEAFKDKSPHLRNLLRTYQSDAARPPASHQGGIFDTPSVGGKIDGVANAVALWRSKYPEYCLHIGSIVLTTNSKSPLEAASFAQIVRHKDTGERQLLAVQTLESKGYWSNKNTHQTIEPCAPTALASSELSFVSFLQESGVKSAEHEYKGLICGRRCGDILQAGFQFDADALSELYEVITHDRGQARSTKSKQMSSARERQDKGMVDFLAWRKKGRLCDDDIQGSFWRFNIPPAGAGRQCLNKVELLVNADTIVRPHRPRNKPTSRAGPFIVGNYLAYIL